MEARTAASNVRKRPDTERFLDAAQGRQRAFLAPAERLALKGDKLTRPRANARAILMSALRRRAPARRTCTAALAQETEQKAEAFARASAPSAWRRPGISGRRGPPSCGRSGPHPHALASSMIPRWRLMSALVSPAGGRADHNGVAWSLAIVVDTKRGLGITAPEPGPGR